MRLLGVSDLHVGHPANRRIVEELGGRPDDWLAVIGDVGDTIEQCRWALDRLRRRFARVIWVPGNHELWTRPPDPSGLRGQARYEHLVEICAALEVLTPEDPYPVVDDGEDRYVVAPVFTLYDYSFRSPGRTKEQALRAAADARSTCTDEYYLHADPHPSREAWCRARIGLTEKRLDALGPLPIVLLGHYPVHARHAWLPSLPMFSMWCGTSATETWPQRYPIASVAFGHLHRPATFWEGGVRYDEVSLGYPRERRRGDRYHPRVLLPRGRPPA